MLIRPGLALWLSVLLLLTGCQSTRTLQPAGTAAGGQAAGTPAPPVDVGVKVFNDGVVDLDPDQLITTPSVRRAEAHYMPQVLAETIARRSGFGHVRVLPERQSEMDLWIDGSIVESTGTRLELAITVSDAKGRVWYTREYDHEVNRYAYDPDPTLARRDPFQPIYEQITDDLLKELARRPAGEIAELRAISQLKFAQRFAPEQFSDYLGTDEKGLVSVRRLPAVDDPALARVNEMRQRDRQFTDQIGSYFHAYSERMAAPYDNWRRVSHQELTAMNKLKGQEVARKIGGALAVIGGIAAMAAGDSAVGVAGAASVAGGAYLFKSGMDKGAQARIHAQALNELAESMGGDMRPHHITLRDQTFTLTGTVEEQYAQWRGLLKDLYVAENAGAPPVLPQITVDAAAPAPAP
jgi:hypothetical protein